MNYLYRVTAFLLLGCAIISAQPISPKVNTDFRLKQITYLAGNFDSLTRSFLKRGFSLAMGSRDPVGAFTNDIFFPNGSSIHLEAKDILHRAPESSNNTYIREITFEVGSIDSFAGLLAKIGVGFHVTQANSSYPQIYLDSLYPVNLRFIPRSVTHDSTIHHHNGTFRIDWVLLSASKDLEFRLRALFDSLGVKKYHEGCCDFWRLGDEYDFTLIRFEPPKLKPLPKANGFSVEEGNIYFAY